MRRAWSPPSFEGYGVACADFFRRGFIVGVQVPAFVGSFFDCGDGVVDVVFACATDVGSGHVAFVVGCVTAEQVRQVGLGCVQKASENSRAWLS